MLIWISKLAFCQMSTIYYKPPNKTIQLSKDKESLMLCHLLRMEFSCKIMEVLPSIRALQSRSKMVLTRYCDHLYQGAAIRVSASFTLRSKNVYRLVSLGVADRWEVLRSISFLFFSSKRGVLTHKIFLIYPQKKVFFILYIWPVMCGNAFTCNNF